MTSVYSTYDTLNAHQRPMVGDTKMSAVAIDHIGWLKCDGRLLNVTDYYFLWEAIGYSFGGSGSQFYLPDPAGRVPGVIGSGVGLTTRHMGDLSGEETHVLTIPEMPIHHHTGQTDLSGTGISMDLSGVHHHTAYNTVNGRGTHGISVAGSYDVDIDVSNTSTSDAGLHKHDITDPTHRHHFTSDNTGGSLRHNNIQPTIFMGNMFIYSGKPNDGKYPYFAGGLF